jgi:hypothetical protein
MAEMIRLVGNFIGKADREKLESFAGHTIVRGRATPWDGGKDADEDEFFEIYPGSADSTASLGEHQ